MKGKYILLCGLTVAALALSGCGGGGGNDSAGPQSSQKTVSTYTINFDLNGGSSPTHGGGYSITVETLTSDVFFFDCVKDGWNFRGWSYNGTKIFDEKGNRLATPEMSPSMTFVAMYAQTAKMTIIKNMPEAGTVSGEGEYPYNTYVGVSAKAKQDYEFVGWYFEDTLLSNAGDYKYMMWSEDVTLEARFKLASFLLDVRSSNENFGLVLLKSSHPRDYLPEYQERRDYTTDVTIAAYSKTDVRFLGWYDESNSLVETNAVYNFVMPNHDYALEAKWNHFNITYNLNGGANDPSNPDHYTLESGKITLKNPTKSGYDFVGWQLNGEYVAEIDPSWMEGVTLNAVWEASDYSITYELNGGANDPSNPSSYTIESGSIAFKPASRKGYTFLGWYDGPSFASKVSGIPAGSHGDVTVYAKWEAISYSVTYNLNGGTNDPTNPDHYTVESGRITLKNPTKVGYDFVGWQLNGEYVTEIDPGWVENLTLEAVWKGALNELSVTSEDVSKGTAAVVSGSGYTDESITVKAEPIGDCVFMGWYHENEKVNDDAAYTFTMPAGDYSLVAHFYTKEEKYATKPFLSEDGHTVRYGLYPQKNVDDTSVVSALNALTTPESNGWYLYNGDYYAKATAKPYESDCEFDNGTKIVSGSAYWFRCEPIEWNVLSKANGEYYVLSSLLLDVHCYYRDTNNRTIDGKTVYLNNYEHSDIREWLNADFYGSAFALGNENILVTAVDNSAPTTDSSTNPYACGTTYDKVFLPSYQDYLNSDYGFSTSISSSSTRYCKTTDWARAMGAYCNDSSGYLNNGDYWTRSPLGFHPGAAWYVIGSGGFQYDSVSASYGSVRPGLSITIA